MTQAVLQFLGGVGLFLFGMEVMTAALREMAAGRLRQLLARFTRTPLRGVATGAMATAAVQSSSAVTVMTIGFVGAGLIGFSQSLGVLYGANIGTTITGWVVMLLGFKLKLGLVALPILFIASLMGILGRGRTERLARILAGFSLLFIGLEMMQAAMAGVEGRLTPTMLPGEGWFGRLQLVGIGLGLTVIMQASAAGVALALVLLGSAAISFEQAAAMVIGMNIGTTVTGMLAAIGGARPMRMTAWANLLFNVGTALLAFPLLALIGQALLASAPGGDAQTALVLFHSGFNILGTLVFLPLTARFAGLVEHLVPERRVALAAPLDPRLLGDEGAAMDAAQAVADAVARASFAALADALGPEHDLRALAALNTRAEPALRELGEYLAKIRLPVGRADEQARYSALVHQLDHLGRLLARAGERDRIGTLAEDKDLSRPARVLGVALAKGLSAARLARIARLVGLRAHRFRRGALLREHAGLISVADLFHRTDAMRWLERVFHHAERITHYAETARHK